LKPCKDSAKLNNCSFYAAAPYLEGKAGTSISAFVRLIDHMRDATRHNTLPETVDYVIQHSGLIQHYLVEREGQDRVENLQELVNAATAFIAEEGFAQDTVAGTDQNEVITEMSPLAGFLAHASLEAGDNQAQAGQDAVQFDDGARCQKVLSSPMSSSLAWKKVCSLMKTASMKMMVLRKSDA
jgi:DNA helicase II / ATP-dependent DNA helicase PcrA